MTEAEWLACEDPEAMLNFVHDRASARKLRLLLVACARLVWGLIPVAEAREAAKVAERYADGHATEEERDRLSEFLWSFPVRLVPGTDSDFFRTTPRQNYFAYLCAQLAVHRPTTGRITTRATWTGARELTRAHQPRLLRDIFGSPFRTVSFSPGWRTETVIALAKQMYESRDFGAMPILADALQDAGCDSEDILGHCRGPGPHVRGCWVVDLVLGKE
jgi:hypothetical protein